MNFLNKEIKVKHMFISNALMLLTIGCVAQINHEVNINHQNALQTLIAKVSEQKIASPEYINAMESRLADLEIRVDEIPVYDQAIERHPEIDYSVPVNTKPEQNKSIREEVQKRMETCDPMKNRLHYELFAMPAPGCDY